MPNPTKPTLSIICATYNRADALPRAIESVISQEYKSWELLIIDDGSTDSTSKAIKPYLADNRVSYNKLKSNSGVGTARNIGVSLAKGDWIVLLDSDNALAESALFEMHLATTNNPEIKMHKFSVMSFENKRVCDKIEDAEVVSSNEFLRGKYQGEFHTLVAKKSIQKILFFEKFNGGEGIVWSKIALDLKRVMFHPEVTEFYETSGSNRLSERGKNNRRLVSVYCADVRMLWTDYLLRCPEQLLIRIGKLLYYFCLARINK